jgi:hypothetical protein
MWQTREDGHDSDGDGGGDDSDGPSMVTMLMVR